MRKARLQIKSEDGTFKDIDVLTDIDAVKVDGRGLREYINDKIKRDIEEIMEVSVAQIETVKQIVKDIENNKNFMETIVDGLQGKVDQEDFDEFYEGIEYALGDIGRHLEDLGKQDEKLEELYRDLNIRFMTSVESLLSLLDTVQNSQAVLEGKISDLEKKIDSLDGVEGVEGLKELEKKVEVLEVTLDYLDEYYYKVFEKKADKKDLEKVEEDIETYIKELNQEITGVSQGLSFHAYNFQKDIKELTERIDKLEEGGLT